MQTQCTALRLFNPATRQRGNEAVLWGTYFAGEQTLDTAKCRAGITGQTHEAELGFLEQRPPPTWPAPYR